MVLVFFVLQLVQENRSQYGSGDTPTEVPAQPAVRTALEDHIIPPPRPTRSGKAFPLLEASSSANRLTGY